MSAARRCQASCRFVLCPPHLVAVIWFPVAVGRAHVSTCTWAVSEHLWEKLCSNTNPELRCRLAIIPAAENKQQLKAACCQDGRLGPLPSTLQTVRRRSFTRWECSVSGAREKASGEETPPQTQPEAQVRVSGDARQRNIWQSEESQGKIRQTGKNKYSPFLFNMNLYCHFTVWSDCVHICSQY